MITVKRIIIIILIYLGIVAAWNVLGKSIQNRTTSREQELKTQAGSVWGTVQHQKAPVINFNRTDESRFEDILMLDSSELQVDLNLDQRRKGLLWYSRYKVSFDGKYTVKNPCPETKELFFQFFLPSQGAIYEDFSLTVDGQEIENVKLKSEGFGQTVSILPHDKCEIEIKYKTWGMDEWWYSFGNGMAQMKNFSLLITTDFDMIDLPENSILPTEKEHSGKGWKLRWHYGKILSGTGIGLHMPQKLNPGPLVSNITGFAPLSLILFFFITIIFAAIKDIRLHPMHYFFIAAAFFTYHLLLAYLVEHLSTQTAFWLSSFVALYMVISYMRIVSNHRFAFMEIGLSQLVFLIAFSYSFFFQGFTGLAITIMCVATLFIVMQVTARFNWESFADRLTN